jgi:alpha-ribazole phosphatase
MPRLLLVRHGETELKSSERLWGQTDVELSPLGLKQAERLRDRLATQKIGAIYASDLKRASATAEIIASAHNLPVITSPELREFNYGKIEGLTIEEAHQLYPEFSKLARKRSPDLRFPDGESLLEMSKRVDKFAKKLKKHTAEETILVVFHSGVLRVLICRLMGMELACFYKFALNLASLSILNVYPSGATLSLFNDASHLYNI